MYKKVSVYSKNDTSLDLLIHQVFKRIAKEITINR